MQQNNNVLVVEDDQGIREMMKIFLEMEGYHVVTAADGREGLERLSRLPEPGLVLLDLMMPVMNGWEFLEALKDTNYAQMPVVVVTAYADKVGGTQCVGVIGKPIDLDALLKTVRKWCGSSLDHN
jgi:two-component system response regulator CpxR